MGIGGDLVLTNDRAQEAFYGGPGYPASTSTSEVHRDRIWLRRVAPDYAIHRIVGRRGRRESALPFRGMFVQMGPGIASRGATGDLPPFSDGMPSGDAIPVLTGFLSEDGKAQGRPVGVAVDSRGALLVADDVGNVIWRVSRSSPGR
jgi:glucose/arabinose dehydrogenase